VKYTHNIKIRDVKRMQQLAAELGLSRAAILKLKWIEFYLTHEKNISLTARHFGIARSTFTRWARRFDPRDPDTLEEQSCRPIHVRQPETPIHIVALIERYRRENPTLSKELICKKLNEEQGIEISSATVGRTIQRHGFFFAQTPSHKRKRMAVRERGVLHEEAMSANEIPPEISGESFPFSPQLST
jgi:transposase